ncbi:MAG: TerC family protein [Crocinitomicaceae bacterium]|nr:TerC family protein [Crocinitomicaceae bacterium]
MDFFHLLFTWDGFMYFILLALLEIVLGIDNIIFVSIVTDKLPKESQRKARNLGLTLALVVRLVLLAGVAWLMELDSALFPNSQFEFLRGFSWQSVVLLAGGLFLIYKSTVEMHNSMSGEQEHVGKEAKSFRAVIVQIIIIDLVFSFDSIITAVGMTNGMGDDKYSPIVIIYAAIIVSMIIMMTFAKQISDFINNRPTIKIISLGFLVTIGVVLVAEAFGQEIPKGYIYFAMVYALIVEFINIKMRKNLKKKRANDK